MVLEVMVALPHADEGYCWIHFGQSFCHCSAEGKQGEDPCVVKGLLYYPGNPGKSEREHTTMIHHRQLKCYIYVTLICYLSTKRLSEFSYLSYFPYLSYSGHFSLRRRPVWFFFVTLLHLWVESIFSLIMWQNHQALSHSDEAKFKNV